MCLWLLASCSTSVSDSTPTPLQPGVTLPAPSPSPSPTATSTPVPPRPQYTLRLVLDYAARSAAVDETIVYPNHSGAALTDLVLAVEPNFWPNCFNLSSLKVDGSAISDYTLEGHRLAFRLPAVLAPEAFITLETRYTLNLPSIQPNPNLPPRIFGYSPLQINLTNWYPFVVPNRDGEWVLHDPVGFASEHLVYEAADYVVYLEFADAAHPPVVAASGAPTPNGEGTMYTLLAGRAFALSISPQFLSASQQVGEVTVTSYYFPSFEGSGQAALAASARALEIYAQRYGPYPHPTLSVVMGDFSDSKEFSAFYFHSRNFYQLYDGTQQNYLTFVAAHETAHQWWFEQVGSDQALQPWLDEALATYSEHIFYEAVDPDLLRWWWSYRMYDYNAQGWVDGSIYTFADFDAYRNAVYWKGAYFLDELRARIGDEAFFAFLQDYLKQENGRLATTAEFFRLLAQHTSTDYSDIVRQYFQNVY